MNYQHLTFNYQLRYKDHLGNLRLSYTEFKGKAKTIDENHYYPFGLRHQKYMQMTRSVKLDENQVLRLQQIPRSDMKYKYKYNGKEWQDELNLNLYDYGARNYDAAIGRWGVVDPLAEKYPAFTPYNYVMNNPILKIDKDGRKGEDGLLIKRQELWFIFKGKVN